MPSYEYTCKCGWSGTIPGVRMAARDEQVCATCTARLIRTEIPSSIQIDLSAKYQSAAILADGTRSAGQFGVSPQNKKGYYKP